MESAKVVDTVDIEDMGDKVSFFIDNLISGLIYDINEVFR